MVLDVVSTPSCTPSCCSPVAEAALTEDSNAPDTVGGLQEVELRRVLLVRLGSMLMALETLPSNKRVMNTADGAVLV